MKKLLIAAVVATISSGALAAEKINWTGPYLGGSVGYGWGEQNFKDGSFIDGGITLLSFPGSDAVTKSKPNLDSAFGGLQAGYNYRNNNTLLGLDLSIKGGSFDTNYQGTPDFDFTAKSKMNWISTGKVKAGLFIDETLVYATGGLALGREKISLHDNYDGYSIDTSNSKTRTGWVIGLGAEHPISNNLTAKIDYEHIDFGDENFKMHEGNTGWQQINIKATDKFDMLSVGLNYHF